MTPHLTVVIPTYNNVKYIDQCLDSIIVNQEKLFNIEIIVGIDNCEETRDYIITKKEKYKDVKFYFFNKNVGPYVVKNTLVNSYAKSDNILFFDSDDVCMPNKLNSLYGVLLKQKFVRFKYENFDLNGVHKSKIGLFAEGVIGINKKTFLSLNGYYPWKCAADTELRERAFSKNIKIYRFHVILFHRRLHPLSLTHNNETSFNSSLRMEYIKLIKHYQNVNYPNPEILHKEDGHYLLF